MSGTFIALRTMPSVPSCAVQSAIFDDALANAKSLEYDPAWLHPRSGFTDALYLGALPLKEGEVGRFQLPGRTDKGYLVVNTPVGRVLITEYISGFTGVKFGYMIVTSARVHRKLKLSVPLKADELNSLLS